MIRFGRRGYEQHQAMLRDYLIPFEPFSGGTNWTFLQDNVSCHTSKYTKKRFKKEKIVFCRFQVGSPDLNLMDNLRGVLCPKFMLIIKSIPLSMN